MSVSISPKQRSKIITNLLLGLASVAFGLVSTQADAANERKWYPGTICQGYYAGTQGEWFGAVTNHSFSDDLTLNCPFVKSHSNSSLDSGSYVQVFDRSSAEAVTCTLYNGYSASGIFYVNSDTKSSTGSSETSTQTLSFGFINTLGGSVDKMAFGLCTVPNRQTGKSPSGVVSWHINENY